MGREDWSWGISDHGEKENTRGRGERRRGIAESEREGREGLDWKRTWMVWSQERREKICAEGKRKEKGKGGPGTLTI